MSQVDTGKALRDTLDEIVARLNSLQEFSPEMFTYSNVMKSLRGAVRHIAIKTYPDEFDVSTYIERPEREPIRIGNIVLP